MDNPLETDGGSVLHCGWGRLIFAHTFPDATSVASCVLEEQKGQRDIAFYLNDPHLVLNFAPQQLFLDPSNTYRLDFAQYRASDSSPAGFTVGRLAHKEELDAINRIYRAQGMVPLDVEHVWEHRRSEAFQYIVARSDADGEVIGVAMGCDHMVCFDDLRNGCSLWALAVDPKSVIGGVGEWLVRELVELYQGRGRAELDLSVMHSNEGAIQLYGKIGFKKVAVFAVKNRNRINERLFVGSPASEGYNPYARIIIDEALRRGIGVDPFDPARGLFRLSLGGRIITCRESLSDMTTAIAVMRTDDKQLTREMLTGAGLSTPDQITAGKQHEMLAFLNRYKSVVVKPLHGEQGKGISVDVRTAEELLVAIEAARDHDETVLIEEFVEGEDLRIIVIKGEVVAAAVRRPPIVIGTGTHTIEQLIERLSRRRAASTSGESRIPLDAETRRCVHLSGYTLEEVLPAGVRLQVRKTANLHTGGVIVDVTDQLSAVIARSAVRAAQVLEIPVVGLDLIVPDVSGEKHVFIEANERPGLANHEPQPTAEKFIDFLFPQTIALVPEGRTTPA